MLEDILAERVGTVTTNLLLHREALLYLVVYILILFLNLPQRGLRVLDIGLQPCFVVEPVEISADGEA